MADFETLIKALRPLLGGYLRNRVSEAWIDDLCQEVFLRIYNALDRYDSKRSFTSWALTIASRLVIDMRREEGNRLSAELDGASLPEPERPTPLADLSQKEQADRLWSLARERLTAREFEALTAHYRNQKTLAETAGIMKLTTTHVKVLLHRARKKLLEIPDLFQEEH